MDWRDLAEVRQFTEWGLYMYLSVLMKPDIRFLKETLQLYLSQLQTRLSFLDPGLILCVQDLHTSLSDSESYLTDISTALLQLIRRLIDCSITAFSPIQTPESSVEIYMDKEEIVRMGVEKSLESAMQGNTERYISIRELESLWSMKLSQVEELVSSPRILTVSDKNGLSVTKDLSTGEFVLEEQVIFYKGSTGIIKVKERKCSLGRAYISIGEDVVCTGARYLLGDCVICNLTVTRQDLHGDIIAGDWKSSLSCSHTQTVYSLGRDSRCSIVLLGSKTSKIHAEITYRNGSWILTNRSGQPVWRSLHSDYSQGVRDSPSYSLHANTQMMVNGRKYTVTPELLVIQGTCSGVFVDGSSTVTETSRMNK